MNEEEKKAIEYIRNTTFNFLEHPFCNTNKVQMNLYDFKKIETLLNLIEKQQKEIEHRDKKLKDIENHIRAELKMIEKCYNEVNLFSKQQYDGMMASYKCLLNIFFGEVEDEN